jgi:hypothetical protein
LCAAEAEYLVPAHLLYLAAYIHENGYEVDLLDVLVEFGVQHTKEEVLVFNEAFEKRLMQVQEHYDIIGISCHTSSQYLPSRDVARICRKVFPKSKIVVGGYHASAVPIDFCYKDSPFDHIVKGEGETAILRIIRGVEQNVPTPRLLSEPAVLDVNDLPDMDYSLISDWSKYSYYYDFFSRGCPFPCVFCMEAVKPERRWRPVTPERAVAKVKRAAKYLGDSILKDTKLLMVMDAIFAPKKEWRHQVLDLLAQESFDFSFFASPKIDTLDEPSIHKFRAANFLIDFPVEHGSVRMLNVMKKTGVPERFLEMTERYMAIANDIGLAHHTHWIIGHPGEDRESARESFEFMKKVHGNNQYGMTEIFFFKLYPGSWLYDNWETVRSWGSEKVIPDDWRLESSTDYTRYHIHPSKDMTRDDILNWVDNELLPYGRQVNKVAFPKHERCCGRLRPQNAPWIL